MTHAVEPELTRSADESDAEHLTPNHVAPIAWLAASEVEHPPEDAERQREAGPHAPWVARRAGCKGEREGCVLIRGSRGGDPGESCMLDSSGRRSDARRRSQDMGRVRPRAGRERFHERRERGIEMEVNCPWKRTLHDPSAHAR